MTTEIIKRPVGRPKKFNNVSEMEVLIQQYFHKCATRLKPAMNKQGYPMVSEEGTVIEVISPAPIHVTGLCEYLEISNETLNQYQEDPEFSESIARAKKRCESYAVDQLFEGKSGNKADFVLKNNFKWEDRTKQDHTIDPHESILRKLAADDSSNGS